MTAYEHVNKKEKMTELNKKETIQPPMSTQMKCQNQNGLYRIIISEVGYKNVQYNCSVH